MNNSSAISFDLNKFEFNCASERGVDWSLYDGVEIAGCVNVSNDDEETCFESIDDESTKPEIVSVYLHCTWGGVECLHDFDSHQIKEARELALALVKAHPQLSTHGINDRYVWCGE